MERKLYGDIENEPGQTKSLGFQAAMLLFQDRNKDQESAAAGAAPESSSWNGVPGGSATEDAIKKNLNDPGSYKLVGAYKPQVATYLGEPCWKTKVVFRAKNSFGALILNSAFVYLTGGSQPRVLGIENGN